MILSTAQADDVDELADSAVSAWDTVVAALPRVGIACAVFVLFALVGRAVRPVVRTRLSRHRTPSFARVFAKLTSSAMTVLGFLLAITIVFPSVRPVDVLSGAGILTIAAGFAFQDILQNLLAGMLLLFRQPFKGGDEVKVGDVVGTVEEINIRETVVTTFDGRRVLVPNARVYTDVISVQTAYGRIRTQFVVGVAYKTDMAKAREVACEAVAGVEGVLREPAPEVVFSGLAHSTMDLEVLLWCNAHQQELRHTLDRALEAVKVAFDREGIEMPPESISVDVRSTATRANRNADGTGSPAAG